MAVSGLAKRRSVALFIPSVNGGGAERAMLVFAREAIKAGHRVDLITASFKGALKEIVPPSVRVIDFGTSRLSASLFHLRRYLQDERPHALFSTITNANVLAAVASRLSRGSTKIIVRQSNVPLSAPRETLRSWMTFKVLPYAYGWVDGIIAVSDGVAHELNCLLPGMASRIAVIPTPVISEEMLQQGEEHVAHPWFAYGEPPVILGAARLVRHKGFLSLIRAFDIIRKQANARLVIIGEGADRALFEAEVERLGLRQHVSMPGFQTNPFSMMNRAKVFVLPSEYEGLPNVLIQAMAFGTPVVATDCKSGPREILRDGTLGQLVPVGDEGALVQAIIRALALPKQQEARASALHRFGAAKAAQAYLSLAGIV